MWVIPSARPTVDKIHNEFNSISSQSIKTSTNECPSDEDLVLLFSVNTVEYFLLKNSPGHIFKRNTHYSSSSYEYVGVLKYGCRNIVECDHSNIPHNYKSDQPIIDIGNYYLELHTNDVANYRRLVSIVRTNVSDPKKFTELPEVATDDEVVQLIESFYLLKDSHGILFIKNNGLYECVGRLSNNCKSIRIDNNPDLLDYYPADVDLFNSKMIDRYRLYTEEMCNHRRYLQVINAAIKYCHPNFVRMLTECIETHHHKINVITRDKELTSVDGTIIELKYGTRIMIEPSIHCNELVKLINEFAHHSNESINRVIHCINVALTFYYH